MNVVSSRLLPVTATDAHSASSQAAGRCVHQPAIDGLRTTLNKALRGKSDVVELVLACVLARGHLLIEDLPGLGKTTLAKALAHAVGGKFARVQCTPDLLPGDVTGFNVFNQKTREFEFLEGPVFSNVLLADEINRTTPRTQSALFEAMAERQVTTDNVCRKLPGTFIVLATQNPTDSHGAYPLPEAQLDRFAVKLRIGYPDRRSELDMLADDVGSSGRSAEVFEPVVQPEGLRALQAHVSQVAVNEAVREYLVDLARVTREHSRIALGLSPRGLLTWQRVAQAWAHLRGRDFATPDDVQEVALPVLSVRLTGDFESSEAIVRELLERVPVPVRAKI
ncbi:MAG TPA: MoxR family ATPase [Pirellulales bacterium]